MMLLVLSLVLAQSPECLSVSGQRVCGYNCVQTPSGGACAQTPNGICERGENNQIACFDPPLFLAHVYGKRLPKPTCVAYGMNMACGYNCARDGAAVACSKTPRGACVANYARVVCFDPPAEVYGVFKGELPEASCLARAGQLACGYGCAASGISVGCAKTPFGTCAEKGGAVTCFDPDKYVVCADGQSTPKPDCVYQSGTYVCGYNCKMASGLVGCAKTPGGSCNAEGSGAPVCFDPPVRGGDEACVELIGLK